MDELFKQVRRARRRLTLQRFVKAAGWCCLATLLVALALVVADKFYPLGVAPWIWGASALGLGVLASAVWAVVTSRAPLDAAIEIDRRFGLKERVSSSLAMSEEERRTEIGQALVQDAIRRVDRIDVGQEFHVKPGLPLLLPLAPALVAVLVFFLVSPATTASQASAQPTAAVKKQVQNAAGSLEKKLVQQRQKAQKEGLEEAQKLFQRLEQSAEEMKTANEGDRKQAMVKLNDLKQELERRRQELGGAEQLQRQLNQLKDVGRGPADKLVDAVRQGNLQDAVRQLEQLKADLAGNKLTDEQKRALADQLKAMEDKLNQAVDDQKKAEDELKQRIDQARKAGQAGEADKLQQQLDKLRQQMPQPDALRDLANKLGQCSKCLKDGQLANAEGELAQIQQSLKDLQEDLKEMEMLDEAMDQMAQARDQMNCPHCGGLGCGECQGDKPGMGLGRGRGVGPRPEEKNDVNFRNSKAAVKVQPGAATVVGEAGGPNVKGDVQQEIQQQLESAKQQTVDPLTGQQMPKKHREHAKEYFDRFREGK